MSVCWCFRALQTGGFLCSVNSCIKVARGVCLCTGCFAFCIAVVALRTQNCASILALRDSLQLWRFSFFFHGFPFYFFGVEIRFLEPELQQTSRGRDVKREREGRQEKEMRRKKNQQKERCQEKICHEKEMPREEMSRAKS